MTAIKFGFFDDAIELLHSDRYNVDDRNITGHTSLLYLAKYYEYHFKESEIMNKLLDLLLSKKPNICLTDYEGRGVFGILEKYHFNKNYGGTDYFASKILKYCSLHMKTFSREFGHQLLKKAIFYQKDNNIFIEMLSNYDNIGIDNDDDDDLFNCIVLVAKSSKDIIAFLKKKPMITLIAYKAAFHNMILNNHFEFMLIILQHMLSCGINPYISCIRTGFNLGFRIESLIAEYGYDKLRLNSQSIKYRDMFIAELTYARASLFCA